MNNLSNTCILILGIVLIFLWILSTKIKSRGGDLFNSPYSIDNINQSGNSLYCREDKECLIFYNTENNIPTIYQKLLTEDLGEGTYGSVTKYEYKGGPQIFSNEIAVKKLKDSDEFNEEKKISDLLRKRGVSNQYLIDNVYISGEIADDNLMILELIDGTLGDLTMNSSVQKNVLLKLAEGLKEFTDKEMYYLDVKPENIGYVIKEDGQFNPKYLDIGSFKTDTSDFIYNTKDISTYPSFFQKYPPPKGLVDETKLIDAIITQQLTNIILSFINQSYPYINISIYHLLYWENLKGRTEEDQIKLIDQVKLRLQMYNSNDIIIEIALKCLETDIKQMISLNQVIRLLSSSDEPKKSNRFLQSDGIAYTEDEWKDYGISRKFDTSIPTDSWGVPITY